MLCPWQLLPLMLMVWVAASDRELLVHKCCGQHQTLDTKHVCRDAVASQDNGDDPWWWLPRSSVSLYNTFAEPEQVSRALSRVRVVYNAMAACHQESRLELVNLPGMDLDEFHLHIGPQQVQLQVVVPDTSPEGARLPAAFFCVDGMHMDVNLLHTAFACVCAGAAPCVRKCCQDYEAYDFGGGGSCTTIPEEEEDRDPTMGSWRPTLQDPRAVPRHFVLRNSKPRCRLGTYRTQVNVSSFHLRDDGHLLMPTGAWLPPEEFCAERVLFNESSLVVMACLTSSPRHLLTSSARHLLWRWLSALGALVLGCAYAVRSLL